MAAADNLANLLKTSLNSIPTPYSSGVQLTSATLFCNVLNSYLVSNTKLTVSFVGTMINPPFTPFSGIDSTVMISGVIQPYSIETTTENTVFDPWIIDLYTKISTALMVSTGSVVIPVTPINAFSNLVLVKSITQSKIKLAFESSAGDVQFDSLKALSEGILTDIMNGYSIIPYASTYSGIYTGVSTITNVSIT